MTIGIAANGAGAGRAVLAALAAVERESRGAIGGFVSFVALDAAGCLHRAECQEGGSAGLFAGAAMPAELAEARVAGLMSSGPNRPVPLSQFVAAAEGVGLVTGHRFPNLPGTDGEALNARICALMAAGRTPKAAIDAVVEANPEADAGFLALDLDGDVYLRNTPLVMARRDHHSRVLTGRDGTTVVAAIHNAIIPHRLAAWLATEIAMDTMVPPDREIGTVTVRSGAPVRGGRQPALIVGDDGVASAIVVDREKLLTGVWSVGLGDIVDVVRDGRRIGRLAYEPFMVLDGGRLVSLDGEGELTIPLCD